MSVIRISDMEFYAFHGCFAEERKIGTHFKVDIALTVDTAKAQRTDDINDTVNYLSVYQVIKAQMKESSNLLEHVADRIAEAVLLEFAGVKVVELKVSKLNPPLGGKIGAVSVELIKVRGNSGSKQANISL